MQIAKLIFVGSLTSSLILAFSEHHRVSGSGTTAECLVGEPTCQSLSTITMPNHHS